MSEAEACAVPRHPVRAVVLAGGAARRLGGVDKPGLRVGAATLLDGVLAALGEHTELGDVVVVGPPRELPRRVRQVSERPPGAGPLAALKAGVAELGEPRSGVMLVLAADLAGVDTTVLGRLVA
ncbi:MAG: molybdenum cofactor guanylyltransferase, partial [Sciscionella sp.]